VTFRRASAGLAAAEYVGIVLVVALVLGALLVLRPHSPGRTPPVRPIPAIMRLLGESQRLLEPPRPPAPPGPRPRPRPRPPRPRPAPLPQIEVPEWLLRP
jgi:hypothetical protein